MSSRIRLAAAILVAAVVVALSGCAAASPPAVAGGFQVTGYAESGSTSGAQLAASSRAMTQVGVDGVNLTADGAGVDSPTSASLRLLAQAHRLHKKASLLFGNYSAAISDFSDPVAEKMFRSSANIHSVVAALLGEVVSGGWDGVTIDLESLNGFGEQGHTRDDNSGLDTFVSTLRAALGHRTLSICISATTGSYRDLGYDLGTISSQVDDVVLMAYDQHGPAWSKAGPVGGTPWVKRSLAGLMRDVPASKIQLGVGEYGYTWPAHGKGTNLSDAAMRSLVSKRGAKATWSTNQQEWHATFDGETVWWSDARTYRARLALAHSEHLAGTAVWSLAQGDPLEVAAAVEVATRSGLDTRARSSRATRPPDDSSPAGRVGRPFTADRIETPTG
jgi:spore germination protein